MKIEYSKDGRHEKFDSACKALSLSVSFHIDFRWPVALASDSRLLEITLPIIEKQE